MEYRASKNKFIRLTLILYILLSTIMLVTTFCKYLLIDFSFFISGRGIFLFLLILLLCFSLLKFAGFYQEIIIKSVFVISFFSFGLAGLLVRGLGSYIIPNEFYRYQTIETRKTNESYEKLYPTTGIYGVETESEIIYDHPIIKQVIEGNYEQMFSTQLDDRKEYHYPPFSRMIRILVSHTDLETVKKSSEWITNVLQQASAGEVLGPVFPPIARLRNRYRMHILVKIGTDQSRDRVKSIISRTLERFETIALFKSCRVNLDIDPY